MNIELELKERIARGAVQLIPPPQATARLREVVANPAHTSAEVLEAVGLSPMLTAVVLRIANSTSFSRGETIMSLPAALARIGEQELGHLAIASGLATSATGASPLLALRVSALNDARSSAWICRRLAPAFGLSRSSLFVAGLLHDLGTMVALSTLDVLAQQPGAPSLEGEAWHALAERHHVELGRLVCERWALPTELRRVIEEHHAPDDGAWDATSVVRISDDLLGRARSGTPIAEADLIWLERVEPDLRAPLLDVLAGIPALAGAFKEERSISTTSLLVSAASLAPKREVTFKVRVSGGRAGEVALLSPRNLLLRLDGRLADHHLAELEVAVGDTSLKLWVRVNHSTVGADGRAETDVVPFAPTPAVVEQLEALWLRQTSSTERAA